MKECYTLRYYLLLSLALTIQVYLTGCSKKSEGPVKASIFKNQVSQPQNRTELNNVIHSQSHHFGTVESNTLLIHKFKIKNDTNHEWKIKGKVIPCTCSKVTLSHELVKPENTLTISVEIKSGSQPRDLFVPIKIVLEKEKIIQLNCQAFIRKLISLNTNTLVFHEKTSDNTEHEVIVHNYSEGRWKSLSVEPQLSYLRFQTHLLETNKVIENDSPIESWKICVSSSDELFSTLEKSHSFQVTATGFNGSKNQERLHCIVRPEVPLRVIPGKIFVIGNKNDLSPITKNAILTSNAKFDDTQLSISNIDEFIEIKEIIKVSPFKRKVSFNVLSKRTPSGINKSIIKVTYGNQHVELPVSIFISESSS